MQIKKGNDRFVVLIPCLGIAVKFPYIRICNTLEILFQNAEPKLWGVLKTYCELPMFASGVRGFKRMLFNGLVANWCEFWFYQTTRHPFLQPTYFSFFGLFNIQRLGVASKIKKDDLWRKLMALTNGNIIDDFHHFDNPENFCSKDGRLRILDYGDPICRKIILAYGQVMHHYYNLPSNSVSASTKAP